MAGLSSRYRSVIILFFLQWMGRTPIWSQCSNADIDSLQKWAFVVGINRYDVESPLTNPENDAVDLATSLRRLHFHVTLDTNVNLTRLMRDFQKWTDSLPGKGVALFYFAGHGGQHNNENYFFPSNGNGASSNTLENSCIAVSKLLQAMKDHNHDLNVIVADACRNNPVMGKRHKFFSRGLSPMESPGDGAMLCFATGSGKTVDDLTYTRNSLYTHWLLYHLESSRVPIKAIFERVRDDVYKTNRNQLPWVEESTGGGRNYCLLYQDTGASSVNLLARVDVSEVANRPKSPKRQQIDDFIKLSDTINQVISGLQADVVNKLQNSDVQAYNSGGDGSDFLHLRYSFGWGLTCRYSRSNAIVPKFIFWQEGNTLYMTITGDNKNNVPGPDLLEKEEKERKLHSKVEFNCSIYSIPWEVLKDTIRQYYLQRINVVLPIL